MQGVVPANLLLHLAVLVGYGLVAFQLALALTRRRLLQ
jgi:hypothetical protein